MSDQEAKQELEKILEELQIGNGDCIMLGIDMGGIPLPSYPAELTKQAFRDREKKWCAFILDILLERIGSEGTLLVPSYSYKYGKAGSIFHSESAESEVGPFTEFFRSRQNTVRSLHPIFSVAGTGRYANTILRNTGNAAFGSASPFARFEGHHVKFVCLGVELRNSITYIHHLEQCYGSPHRYSKKLNVEVYENGQPVEGEWTAYVGYRGINYESDISSLQFALEKAGLLLEAKWKNKFNHAVSIVDVNRVGYELLKQNCYAFVNGKLQLSFDDSFPSNFENTNISKLVVTAAGNADQFK